MTGHITLNAKEYQNENPHLSKVPGQPDGGQVGQRGGDYGDMSDWSAWLMEGWAAGVGQRDPEAGGSLFSTSDTHFNGS